MNHVTAAQPDNLVTKIEIVTSLLPSIAAVVKYYDDFAAEIRSIRDLSDTDQIVLVLDGRTRSLSFNKFGAATQVMKHVFADWLDQHDANYVIVSFGSIASYVARRGINSLIELIVSQPFEARSHWNTFVLAGVTPGESYGLRAMLHSLCRLNIGHWTPQVRSIIRAQKVQKWTNIELFALATAFFHSIIKA